MERRTCQGERSQRSARSSACHAMRQVVSGAAVSQNMLPLLLPCQPFKPGIRASGCQGAEHDASDSSVSTIPWSSQDLGPPPPWLLHNTTEPATSQASGSTHPAQGLHKVWVRLHLGSELLPVGSYLWGQPGRCATPWHGGCSQAGESVLATHGGTTHAISPTTVQLDALMRPPIQAKQMISAPGNRSCQQSRKEARPPHTD